MGKNLHKRFYLATENIAGEKQQDQLKHMSLQLKPEKLKKETDGTVLPAQDQSPAPRWKQHTRNQKISLLFGLCVKNLMKQRFS